MATLSMTPESIAEALAGATGCARGSQKCSGKRPAFEPKPRKARAKTALRSSGGSDPAEAAITENDGLPACPAKMLSGDQERRDERHHLPGQEECGDAARGEHARHGQREGDQQHEFGGVAPRQAPQHDRARDDRQERQKRRRQRGETELEAQKREGAFDRHAPCRISSSTDLTETSWLSKISSAASRRRQIAGSLTR